MSVLAEPPSWPFIYAVYAAYLDTIQMQITLRKENDTDCKTCLNGAHPQHVLFTLWSTWWDVPLHPPHQWNVPPHHQSPPGTFTSPADELLSSRCLPSVTPNLKALDR